MATSEFYAVATDTLSHLARTLAQLAARPNLLPQPIADEVHELLVRLDSEGVAPPAVLNAVTDDPSESLPLQGGSRAPAVGEATIEQCRPRWTWHDGQPADDEAEHTLVGIALVSQVAAREVHQSVPPAAWHDPSLARILDAAVDAPDADRESGRQWALRLVNGGQAIDVTDLEGCAKRVTLVAEAAGQDRQRLVELIKARSQRHDDDGVLAARVIAAAAVREDIGVHIGALERHGLQVAVSSAEVGPPTPGGARLRLASYAAAVNDTVSHGGSQVEASPPACWSPGRPC
jgi:hypothetical protein